MHCGYVSRSATVVRVFFVQDAKKCVVRRAFQRPRVPVLSDRLSVPVISDALSERMSSASRTVRYGPATSASPSWVPSMEKESTTMSTVPSVSAEARVAGDSCLNTVPLLSRVSEGFRHVLGGGVGMSEAGVFASMQVSEPRLVGGHSVSRSSAPAPRLLGHHGNRCAARAGAGRK